MNAQVVAVPQPPKHVAVLQPGVIESSSPNRQVMDHQSTVDERWNCGLVISKLVPAQMLPEHVAMLQPGAIKSSSPKVNCSCITGPQADERWSCSLSASRCP